MLALVAAVVVALYLGLFLGPSATPRLGLDLRGGTQVILEARPLHGKTLTKGALDQAVNIIRNRVNGAGVAGATISTQGNNDIIVSAPGANHKQLEALDQTALLRFRQVLAMAPGSAVPQASPTPTASASAVPSAKVTAKPTAKKTTSHDRVPAALLAAGASPAATPSATPTPTPTPSSSALPSPSASPSAGTSDITPVANTDSADLATAVKGFATYDCSSKDGGKAPTKGNDDPKHYIVACDKAGGLKYLLAPAAVEGTEIGGADATVDANTNQWLVQLHWKGKGQDDWFNLTKKAYEADPQGNNSNCRPPTGCNRIAVVLDGEVESAPASQADGIAGDTQITGNFSQTEATNLANVLKYGALPLKLVKLDSSTVSATLGSAQLRGGLIAGVIGLGLVILYSLLYYRALGLVTVASLALSGAILYAVTTLLGHSSLGYTLSLPGIAGFIVAVGITADSFVVYFERIRDEVREGKRLRSAVERAWPRARRTIISADAVSLLAAVVLYIVSIGDVRGFAFTLGLSTLSDLFIVFFFTKPLLSVMARRRAFDAGAAWTGVGRARAGAILEPREA
ncbi:MAG: protein translocase subunit SecD [Frankiales bacterium]|nr:protein translocase subunit SecD [Frankiales bacterium]